MIATRASPTRAMPGTSRRTPGCDAPRGSTRTAVTSANTPTGTLIRNTSRQPVPHRFGVDQRAGEDRRGDRRQSHHRAEGGEHLRHLLLGEDLLDHSEPLRDEQRAERRPGATRKVIRNPGEGAAAQAADISVKPAEPMRNSRRRPKMSPSRAPVIEQDGERQRVGGAQPLQRRRPAAEVGADRRAGDVDDRRIHQVHDLGGQNDGEHDPPPRYGAAERSAVTVRRIGGDGAHGVPPGSGLSENEVRGEHCS